MSPLRLVAAVTVAAALYAPSANAAEPVPPVPPVPQPAPAPPPQPVPPPVPAPGSLRLSLYKVGGAPPFSAIGRRVTVLGVVTPYVAGQFVKVSFYRDGRKVSVQTKSVNPHSGGAGAFRVSYTSPLPGLVEARAVHYGTTAQGQFTGRSPQVRYVQVNLGPGARGPSVRLLQSELNVLHYAVPLSGVLDEGTARALVAFRKVTGLERISYAGTQVFSRLSRHIGSFPVRFRRDGRHVEANLTKQVLAEIEPGGRVHAIYTMSSGKPSTPTVIGHFQVYSKTPGVNEKGMVDSNYFIRGYAIHGYPEVPTYAASHGCLRVPIPDAAAIFAWVQYGTGVDVYNQSGGGSHHVRGNAGP
jgi:hypothetical protein